MGVCLGVTSFRTADQFAKVHAYYQSALPPGSEIPSKGEATHFMAMFSVATAKQGVLVWVLVLGEPVGSSGAARVCTHSRDDQALAVAKPR